MAGAQADPRGLEPSGAFWVRLCPRVRINYKTAPAHEPGTVHVLLWVDSGQKLLPEAFFLMCAKLFLAFVNLLRFFQ